MKKDFDNNALHVKRHESLQTAVSIDIRILPPPMEPQAEPKEDTTEAVTSTNQTEAP